MLSQRCYHHCWWAQTWPAGGLGAGSCWLCWI